MLKVNWVAIQDKLNDLDIKILTPVEFKRIFNISSRSTQYFLEAYTKKGIFLRLKKGLYAVKFNMPSLYLIANKLYEPSYISFESALAFHNLIPEGIYNLVSATSQPTREFATKNNIFAYHRIKKKFYIGYSPLKIKEETILMAEPEKALADCLYFSSLRKKSLPERVVLGKIKMEKLKKYLKIFKRKNMSRIFKEFLSRNKESNVIY